MASGPGGPGARAGAATGAGGPRGGRTALLAAVEERLALVEAREPGLESLLPEPDRRDRLLREAAALESRWPDPAARPPLFGLLLGVKDLFSAEGFETRAGSRLPAELFRMPESSAVSRLKAAGCLVLGKTVSTEFAYFAPGPTRNPRDPGRTPGGSSSGSAAAVGAGLCDLALGTQTIGSISRPAAFCGIAGYKPSYERVPRDGAVAFSPSLDHVGLLAAGARGLALAAPILVPAWDAAAQAAALEGAARASGGSSPPSGAAARSGSEGFAARPGLPVLLVPEGPYLAQAEPAALAAFERSLSRLAEAGYRVLRVPAFADIAEVNERHRLVAAAEIALVHRDWYPRHRELYAPTTAELIEKGMRVPRSELERALVGRAALRSALELGLAESGAGLWVSPAAPGPAPKGLGATGSPIMNLPWTHAGLPTLALPSAERAEGMPLGLQLAARHGADEELLAWGLGIEAAIA